MVYDYYAGRKNKSVEADKNLEILYTQKVKVA